MKSPRLLHNMFFLVICSLFVASKSFAEPANLDLLREEVKTYVASGQYLKEINQVTEKAESYIDKQAQENAKLEQPKKLAIVLDIDETSLSYYKNMLKRNFYYNAGKVKEEILTANAPAIAPMLELYKNAQKHKVEVFFITARKSYAHRATMRNLKAAGYEDYAALYTRPSSYAKGSIQEFKTATRALIEKKGYTIIASIGDQECDLEGGHALKTFKVPNPFYHIS